MGVGVAVLVSDAAAVRAGWGAEHEVVVAVRDLSAGTLIGPDDVTVARRPAVVVPSGALDEAPVGRRVAADVLAGEILPRSRVARSGTGSTAARLPHGSAAVAVPLGAAPPPIQVGDRVDVLAPEHDAGSWDGPAQVVVVARGAEVLEVGDGYATLVIERRHVEQTAAAVLAGTLTLALTG